MGLKDQYDYNTGKAKKGFKGNIMASRGGVPWQGDITTIIHWPRNKGVSGLEPGGEIPCP
jgi:hypothetical protein